MVGKDKLEAAEAEIVKLEQKCDKLLDQKKAQLERISQLQQQVETLLKSPNIDSQVQDLIIDLESQRDNYKHQVQNLIKDLRTEDRIVIANDKASGPDKQQEDVERNVKKATLAEPRNAFQLPSNIRRRENPSSIPPEIFSRPVPVVEEDDLALELLEAKTELADKVSELSKASLEVSKLRQELCGRLAQLESYRVKQTQTSPSIDRTDTMEKRRKGLESKEREVEAERQRLNRWKDDLNKFKEELELQRSNKDNSDQKSAGDEESLRGNTELRQKVTWLELQLVRWLLLKKL